MKKSAVLIILFCFYVSAAELTLEESINYAGTHNQKIISAKEKVKAAIGNLTAASGLLYPQLSATGVYTKNSALSNYVYSTYQLPVLNAAGIPTGDYIPLSLPSVSADRLGDMYTAKLSLAWPVFTWGKIQGAVEIAEANKSIAEKELIKTLQDVTYEVKSGFYSLLMSEQMVKMLDETRKSLQAHVEVVQKRYEAGLASKFELLRAKVQLANVEPQLNRAKNGYELALMGFNNTLSAETNDKYTAKGEFKYEKEVFDLDACLKSALENRVELKQMKERIKMSQAALNIAVGGFRPSITLTANYNANMGAQLPPNDTVWYYGWDAGGVISIPLFDGFATSGKYEEAEGNLKQAQIGETQLLDGINIEVKGAFLTLEATEKTIIAQAENISMAKESLNMVKERYAQGLSTNLDVLDTEVSYLQTEISYYQSLYDHILAKEKLIKAIGRIGGENVKK
ncbi:MAG: TolC family protein [Candidatus Firestonebacteria bacterium]